MYTHVWVFLLTKHCSRIDVCAEPEAANNGEEEDDDDDEAEVTFQKRVTMHHMNDDGSIQVR